MHAEHQQLDLRQALLEEFGGIEAAEFGHVDVHEDDVGIQFLRPIQGLLPGRGFALFYLRGVAPEEVRTADIYCGVMPFIGIQIAALALFWAFPQIVTFLPGLLFG